MTELLGREDQACLARQKPTEPFLFYLAFGAPHYPMMAPRKYMDRFPATMERDRRTHLATVAAVDDVVGGVLDTLKRQGIEDETIVFFQADNGATCEVRARATANHTREEAKSSARLQGRASSTEACTYPPSCACLAAQNQDKSGTAP
jgi:arylsulfatase A-like enzyme